MDLKRGNLKWLPGRGINGGKWGFVHEDDVRELSPVTAVFFVPFLTLLGVLHVLVPEEDNVDRCAENRKPPSAGGRPKGKKIATPMLGLFGGMEVIEGAPMPPCLFVTCGITACL